MVASFLYLPKEKLTPEEIKQTIERHEPCPDIAKNNMLSVDGKEYW